MAALPQELLQWLAQVLGPEYPNVNRTYGDVASLLQAYRSLSPKTNIYTYENGRSELLLCVSGTLPISFRGATYNIPIALWIPHQYPETPPIALVVPSATIAIRPTNHVDASGRCFHPYLAYWSQTPDKSSLVDLCGQLKDVFGKEPPVASKQQPQQPQQQPVQRAQDQAPPPPPVPAPYQQGREQDGGKASGQTTEQAPPHPPLKPPRPDAYSTGPPRPSGEPSQAQPSSSQTGPPPPPPKPQKDGYQAGQSGPEGQRYVQSPTGLSNRHSSYTPNDQLYQQQSPPPARPRQNYLQQPQQIPLYGQASPIPQRFYQEPQPQQRPMSIHGYPPQQVPQSPLNPNTQPLQQYQPPYQQPQRQQHAPLQQKAAQVNILDSQEDTTPPPASPSTGPPPPLPRNPEKDRLLHEVALALQARAIAAQSRTAASLDLASSQSHSLTATESLMERERLELARIEDVCAKDARILQERMAMAEDLIREVSTRDAPNIDSVVVAPTVVHKQLYELVTDDMAIEDTIYVLGKALDKERIGLDVFLKHTRTLAREQFLKRALVKKISRQIGLE